MKKLLLTDYKYGVGDELKTVDVKKELYEILRMPGMYKNGVETCDGVALATKIAKAEVEDWIEVSDEDMILLRRIFDQLIAREHRPPMSVSLGGERYIELIQRVFMAEDC